MPKRPRCSGPTERNDRSGPASTGENVRSVRPMTEFDWSSTYLCLIRHGAWGHCASCLDGLGRCNASEQIVGVFEVVAPRPAAGPSGTGSK